MDKRVEILIDNLKKRNISGEYFESLEDAKEWLVDSIPKGVIIGVGNSQTLKKMNISTILLEKGHVVYDKTLSKTREEAKTIKKKALLSDWYLTGTNGISLDGAIVNIDHSGNRAAAMIYGPDRVIIIIGTNKIENSLEEAIYRARNVAAPQNAKRAGLNPPCVEANKCVDCRSDDRVCNNILIIEGQVDKNRMTVVIVEEDIGF
ncbi:lactate utilization protein [Alkaliphilus peptidifermentans]|uniref:Uncharacterized ACR, YkgG family COG1556 n=1 Tax=Alkaliphilus peptidifermentans DSM 18978 TaxID=1120976 RepID=A0A1G5KYG7_9FIRM|nr:lactate utilization protein [Alkaliphilus peptidifermentans]SCZ05662.1 Uncharacterised ACR, YkgG family COG1556 [Alkaliphilus peptidifermentans DSM 18978]